ncbi:NicO-domain-containing protein [Microthyrium microscopicum]|uniref:Nickel/cobalt efflux system n=1 Tax=Microthyrium microscopicum TaxID=703497 RepID=A0A6A6TWV0_9PEZI|nr:NicO-domain-containing protein [Microthyrium microscopicum]
MVEPFQDDQRRSLLSTFMKKADVYHGKVPGLNKIPFRSVAIIVFIAIINLIVWAGCGVVLLERLLVPTAVLAYTLGLRHALDADHISAIDLMTRRLVADGKEPVTVGTWFSLGHSTIVIITSIVVAATAQAVSKKFDGFSRVGGIVGTSVSATFLIVLGMMNIYILYKLVQEMRRQLRAPLTGAFNLQFQGTGFLFGLLQKLFKLVDRPWKMYPIGVLFGLGFDTSSEIALLGIASIQAAQGTSVWVILIFPILFTAAMCLLDTTDGALMMAVYTRTSAARDPIVVLYYSIVLTVVTVLAALVIGVVQVLSLIMNIAQPSGPFWDGVGFAGDHYDIIGGSICGSFVVFGGLSTLLYKPWRRWIETRRRHATPELGPIWNDEDAIVID